MFCFASKTVVLARESAVLNGCREASIDRAKGLDMDGNEDGCLAVGPSVYVV